MSCIGLLALQGGFAAHGKALRQLGHTTREVRSPDDLNGVGGLALPGGESTVQARLIQRYGLLEPLNRFHATGKPVLATCAGLVLIARSAKGLGLPNLGWIDVEIERNAWGAQVHSFEGHSDGGKPVVVIRPPRIRAVGQDAQVIDTLDGEPIVVRQGSVYGAIFHPELTGSTYLHEAVFARA